MKKLFSKIVYKMVKYIQTICRQQPTNYLSVFDHFVGFTFKGLKKLWVILREGFKSLKLANCQKRKAVHGSTIILRLFNQLNTLEKPLLLPAVNFKTQEEMTEFMLMLNTTIN